MIFGSALSNKRDWLPGVCRELRMPQKTKSPPEIPGGFVPEPVPIASGSNRQNLKMLLKLKNY